MVQLLAVFIVVALALALLLFVRRAARFLAETRERETFRRTVADLAGRAGTSLDGVAARIDGVRRNTLAPAAIGENLAAASHAVERYADEARGLPGGRRGAALREALVADLERAARALEMVEHGCTILSSPRRSGRDTEAQTAIKRGYLNILHAREAMAEHAARAADLSAEDPPRLFQRRNA
jgi:hypothetical protein